MKRIPNERPEKTAPTVRLTPPLGPSERSFFSLIPYENRP
jgi:hypothetical protein